MATTLKDTQVIRFSPSTTCDSMDLTDGPSGGCALLKNFIADPSTKNLLSIKPDETLIESLSELSSPNNIDCLIVVGNYMYGLVATARNSGKSEPFCYNIANIFSPVAVTVNNVTSGNSPTSYAFGDGVWKASMCQVGNLILVTHAGFSSGHYFGWFDISVLTQPVWQSGNLVAAGGILVFGTLTGGSGYDSGGTAVYT